MCRRDLNTHTYTHAHTETHTRTQADVRVKREGPADNKMEAMREGLPEKKRNRKHLPSSARRRLLLADFTEANGRGRVREKKRVDEVPNVHERVHSSNKVKKKSSQQNIGAKRTRKQWPPPCRSQGTPCSSPGKPPRKNLLGRARLKNPASNFGRKHEKQHKNEYTIIQVYGN